METLRDLLRKHPVELILIITSCIITVSIFMFFPKTSTDVPSTVKTITNDNTMAPDKSSQTYTIDISGAVAKPNVYKVPADSTISDVITIAGGFSKAADMEYIGRNFNLAKGIVNQEKIYIPTKADIEEGLFTPEMVTIENIEKQIPDSIEISEGISINSATTEELDTLPGIGPVTAQKIIDNRPYGSLEELLSKKAINNTNYEKIKDLIAL